MIELIPDSIRRYVPEKVIFKYLLSMKDGLISQVRALRDEIESSNDAQSEITPLTDESNESIQDISASEPVQIEDEFGDVDNRIPGNDQI
jgi:hypothetical protein